MSTLEALGVFLALILLFGNQPSAHRTKIAVVPTWADNRGNGSALSKHITTKFFASAILTKLSACTKRKGLRSPREVNKEVDALANGNRSSFDPQLRIPLDVERIECDLLLAMGREAERAVTNAKARGDLPD